MTPLRTFLLEDETLLRKLLLRSLHAMPELEVVGECGDGVEGERLILNLKPDLLLLDINLPGRSGIDVARDVLQALPDLRILAITSQIDARTVQTTLQLGVAGYVDKYQPFDTLALAVREVAEGRTYFSHNALMELRRLSSDTATARELLTPKETEVLRLVALGHLNKEIADQLGVSIRTVETHRFNLRKKLDLADTASLTRYAIQAGLVKV